MVYAVPPEVIERLEKMARDCLAGAHVEVMAAFGSGVRDGNRSAVEVMPSWLAAVIVVLDKGLGDDKVYDFTRGLAAIAREWKLLDDSAWQRVFVFFSAACLETALEVAFPLQSAATRAYWDQAQGACAEVLTALRGETQMGAAASAADVAAWAWQSESVSFDAAKLAAPSDATWALKCVTETARHVAQASLTDASVIANAAEAAARVAGDPICMAAKEVKWLLAKRLFSLVNTEIAAAKGWSAPLSFL